MPDCFPLASVPEIPGVSFVEVKYSENTSFENPIVSGFRSINENQQRQLGFKFEKFGSKLAVSKWSDSGHLKKVGILNTNAWLRVIENERESLEYTWGYYKHVYNIYFGNASEFCNSLSSQKPVTLLNTEKNLW